MSGEEVAKRSYLAGALRVTRLEREGMFEEAKNLPSDSKNS